MKSEAWLRFLLRLSAVVEMFAFIAVVLPRPWMEAAHRWLGMGEMPTGPLIGFLIRETSFMYGLHGIGMWILSMDVVRYRPLIILSAIGFMIAGPVFFLIEWFEGMPKFWIAIEGPSVYILGVLIYWAAINVRGRQESPP